MISGVTEVFLVPFSCDCENMNKTHHLTVMACYFCAMDAGHRRQGETENCFAL